MGARMRTLRPDFFLDEELSEVSIPAQFLLAGLWVVADREGRLEDRPKRIKAQVFPYRHQLDIEELLGELAAGGHITRYEAEGQRYIAITDWDGQRPHKAEAPSRIPPPPSGYTEHQPSTASAPTQQLAPADQGFQALAPFRLGSGILDPGSGSKDSPPADAGGFALEPVPGPKERKTAEEKRAGQEALALRRQLKLDMAQAYQRATGQEYDLEAKPAADNAAVAWASEQAQPQEVLRRWGNLLTWATASPNGYPTVSSMGALRTHWNTIQVSTSPPTNHRAPVRADTTDWSDPHVEEQRF